MGLTRSKQRLADLPNRHSERGVQNRILKQFSRSKIARAPRLFNQSKTEKRAARRGHDVLPAVQRVSHRRSVHRRPGAEVPEFFSRLRVKRDEVAFHIAGENEPTRCRKHAGPWRRYVFEFPLNLSRQRINGAQCAPRTVVGGFEIPAADVGMSGMKGL